jgi:putative ABC transport system permease protein
MSRKWQQRRYRCLLTAVALVSLAVGGIGISNIMLVTVAQRTREIGLRLALGARQRDMLLQFLTEATTLALLGGIVGALIGIAASVAIAALADWPVIISVENLIIAMAFAAGVGCFFGFYPARKASRMDPIDALRCE